MMERAGILAATGALKPSGMRTADDALMAAAVRRHHEPARVAGDLLSAGINAKTARSVNYRITTARPPVAREINEVSFDAAPANATRVRDLAGGEFLQQQRKFVLTGGTGTGKTRTAAGIARAVSRNGARTVPQRGGPREQTCSRSPRRPCWPHRWAPRPPRLRRHGRTRLSALRPVRRTAPLPSHQQAL